VSHGLDACPEAWTPYAVVANRNTVLASVTMIAIVATLALLLVAPQSGTVTGGVEQDSAFQHYLRAEYYILSARLQQAISELNKAIEADPGAAAPRVTLGRLLLSLNRPDEALEALEAAEKLNPNDPTVPKLLGRIYLQLMTTSASGNDYAEKAEKAFKRAIEIDDQEQESLYYLALLYEQKDRIDEAIDAKRRLLRLNPSLRDVWLSLATSLSEKGDSAGEFEALAHAVKIDPNNAELLRRAGEAAESAGRLRDATGYFERATELLSDLLRKNPGDPLLLLLRADLYLWNTQQYDLAAADCDEVMKAVSDPTDGRSLEAKVTKATALYFMEDFEPAAELFESSEGLVMSQLIRSFEEMVIAYAQTGRGERALRLIRDLESRAVAKRQKSYLRWLKARVLDKLGRGDEALKIIESQVAADPGEWQNHLRLVQFRIDRKEYSAAEKALQEGNKSAGEQKAFLFLRGVLQERLGDIDGAVETFTLLVESDPDDHLALNYLGYLLADRGVDVDKAVEYIKRALELQPHNGSYLDSLGWAYFKQGNIKLAEKYLTAAVRTQYRSAEVREHLGYLYLALGRKAEALKEFRAALDLGLSEVKSTEEVEKEITALEKAREEGR